MTNASNDEVSQIPFCFTLFRNLHAQTADARSMSWGATAAFLCAPPRVKSKKLSSLIKLATFGTQATKMGSLRSNENLLQIFGIEGDYDAGQITVAAAADMLRDAGIEAVICTTANHSTAKPRWRVFSPLSRPCRPDDRLHFAGLLNAALGGVLAPESFVPSQCFFVGQISGRDFEALHIQGNPLDSLDGPLTPVYPEGSSHLASRTPRDFASASASAKNLSAPAPTPEEEFRQVERQGAIDRADDETIDALQSALAMIPADDRDTWVRMGQAMASLKGTSWEPIAEVMWVTWSRKSSKYQGEKDAALWATFGGNRSDPRAVFAEARRHGAGVPSSGVSLSPRGETRRA